MTITLDPDAQKMLDMAKAANLPPLETLTPEQARARMKIMREKLAQPVVELAEVRDLSAPGPAGQIPLRLYRARPSSAAPSQPAIVFFHGGGWLFGDLDSHDHVCRHLARHSNATVIAVDYRLAPEHKFPAAHDDSYAAANWIADNAAQLGIDKNRLAVAGDSAGGNLATAVALMAIEQGGPKIVYQLLVYPVTDFGMTLGSYTRAGTGYTLTASAMHWFRELYLRGDSDRDDWRASPLRAKNLSKLPPAIVITAGADPLHDDGEHYAKALEKAGVKVKHVHYPGQMHGFIGLSGHVIQADDALAKLADAVKGHWGAE